MSNSQFPIPKERHRKLIINTDGGARNNPGPAGIGVVIADETGDVISRHKKYIGEATNNEAEYQALIFALREAAKIPDSPFGPPFRVRRPFRVEDELKVEGQFPIPNQQKIIVISMDSELIIRQMQGQYKIKDSKLKVLAAEVFEHIKKFQQVIFKHIPREQNREADKLVNEAIDAATT